MADQIQALPPPDDSRQYLSALKKVLENFKDLKDEDKKMEGLCSLVSLYLDCPSKVPAKRVMASFFQNLDKDLHSNIESNIQGQLLTRLKIEPLSQNSTYKLRQMVDCIAALMENFQMGEHCLSAMTLEVITFLAEAKKLFLLQIHEHVPPVRLNEAMHHCHVTVQTLTLVIQKMVVDSQEMTKQLVRNSHLIASIFELDLHTLKNDLFLLDCRCCCAMNAILLLQLSLPAQERALQIPAIIQPDILAGDRQKFCIPWLTQSQAQSINMMSMSTLSYLCMAFGYIAAVDPVCVGIENWMKEFFYVDHLLPSLLSHGLKCKDTVSKALYGKTVNLWTSKLLTTLKANNSNVTFLGKLHGESPALQSLLTYVWTFWDDQLDVIRQSAKTVFENVLKVHCLVTQNQDGTLAPDLFVQSVLHHLFSVSWTSRGKFSALTSCVKLLGTQTVLTTRPDLPTEVVQQLQEQAISCYASELYASLFTSHQQEIISKNEHQGEGKKDDLLTLWLEPVVQAMCSKHKKLKQNVIEYLLPKLLKLENEILSSMIERLSATSTEQAEPCYGAIVMCLCRARVLGLLKSTALVDDKSHLWFGYLHLDVLKAALCSSDEQIRLDAFALVCENHKTAETITVLEFDMLKFFIPDNLNSQSPAFRQAFTALLKKLFFRAKESMGALKRLVRKEQQQSQSARKALSCYEDFLTFLLTHLLNSLYPGAAFARRTTSLAVLSLMTVYFTPEKDGFAVCKQLTGRHLWALQRCLTDTFEENKKEALNILTNYLAHQGPIWDKAEMADVLRCAMTLAWSTRPQDGPTAVYHFLLILKQAEQYPSQWKWAEVLPMDILPSSLVIPAETSNYLCLLWVLLASLDDQITVANQSLITAAANRPMYPTLHCIRYILHELNFKTMEPNLIGHTREFLHDLTNSCLRMSQVVSPVVQNSSPEGHVPEDAILGPGLNIANVLPSVAADGSTTPATDTLPESVVLSRALVESMPEYLVVCCWRSIKEVSLTLGKICLQVPVSQISVTDTESTLLSFTQIQTIGQYFTQQLLESIHRGAFELAYAGFQLMCQMLWNHPIATFHQLPGQWLKEVITDIRADNSESKFCSTRRSAGIPFFVQAITSSEPAATGRKCFHGVMAELLELAMLNQVSKLEQSEGAKNAQVHALNILRALFRDARLGEDVVPYVADGLKSAILGFRSDLWAVRNSATLLLSALMTRMFGVKRSKDEMGMSKKNCQTGRAFFHRYPSLYPFLLAELKEATSNIGCGSRLPLHPSLYPVLLLLGRLFPSTLEGSDTSLSLSAFIPYVISCASSPVYKTRIMAARAIQPLARRNEIISISHQLFDSLPKSSSSQKTSSSHIHGSLLQLCKLIELVGGFAVTLQREILASVIPCTYSHRWLVSRENKCFGTRQQALLLIDLILDISDNLERRQGDFSNSVTNDLHTVFLTGLIEGGVCMQTLWHPLSFDYEKTRAELCLKHLDDLGQFCYKHNLGEKSVINNCSVPHLKPQPSGNTFIDQQNGKPVKSAKDWYTTLILNLLRSPMYEVRLGILDRLQTMCCQGDRRSNSSHEDNTDTEEVSDMGQAYDTTSVSLTGVEDQSKKGIVDDRSELATEVLTCDLLDQLMLMALEKEDQHECLEKVFFVLASLPTCSTYLAMKEVTEIYQILNILLSKMSKERRVEVKAAILKFSGFLLPFLYDSISTINGLGDNIGVLARMSCVTAGATTGVTTGNTDVVAVTSGISATGPEDTNVTVDTTSVTTNTAVGEETARNVGEGGSGEFGSTGERAVDSSAQRQKEWLDVLKLSSKGDENPELQISCCHVLLDNAKRLFLDSENKLGEAKFLPWDCLANLLQEDDLEVKELAACVLCVIQGQKPSSYHPSYALHCLPAVLVSVHGERDLTGVLICLLKWVMQEDTDVQDSNERLFDKGEMNTYWDQVAFSRSITMTLAALFDFDLKGKYSDLANSSEDRVSHLGSIIGQVVSRDRMDLTVVLKDKEFSAFLRDSVATLTKDLTQMVTCYQKTDTYFNNGRYHTLWQSVFKAKVFLLLFDREVQGDCAVPQLQELRVLVWNMADI